jgi:hypothetical protein
VAASAAAYLFSSDSFAPIGIALSASSAINAGLKLDIINAEMRCRPTYSSTRCRDIFLGAGISFATAGLGHGVSHVVNYGISQAAGHAVSHGQHLAIEAGGLASEKGGDYGIDKGLEKRIDSIWISGIYRRCDECYKVRTTP